MKITQSTLRKIIREELQEAYKSDTQRDKELNAEIRMIKKDPEFRALVALEKAYHGRKRSIDDESPTVRYILNRRVDWSAMSPVDAMSAVIQDMSPGLHEFAIKFEAMQPYFRHLHEADLNPKFRKNVREALPRDQLFKLIRDEGLIMHDVNREEFFQWLDKRGFTTKDAVEANRQLIAGWLKKSRAAWVRKNR